MSEITTTIDNLRVKAGAPKPPKPRRGNKRYAHSRITNSKSLLPGIDGRSAWVRRCKDIIAKYVSDLGGLDNICEAERSIIRRAAVLTVELERLEGRFATAGAAAADDLELYMRAMNTLRRQLESIGLERRPKDVTPSLKDYLEATPAREEEMA